MQITKYSPCNLNSRKPSFIKLGTKLWVLEQLQVVILQKMLKSIFLKFVNLESSLTHKSEHKCYQNLICICLEEEKGLVQYRVTKP